MFLGLALAGVPAAAGPARTTTALAPVRVTLHEDLPAGRELDPPGAAPSEAYFEPAFAFPALPRKYSANALPLDRSTPFALRAQADLALPPGAYLFRLRARGAARFLVDGRELAATEPQKPNGSAHMDVPPPPEKSVVPMRLLPAPHQEKVVPLTLDGSTHRFTVAAVIGGKGLVPTAGELSVSFGRKGETPRLLGGPDAPRLTDAGWEAYAAAADARHRTADRARRVAVGARVAAEWSARHTRIRAWLLSRPAPAVPQVSARTPVRNDIDRFLGARLEEAQAAPTPLTGDLQFLRRLALDTTGTIPTAAEIRRFQAESAADRSTARSRAIDRYLASPAWADHWLPYWQDVLAENPGILKPDLNNTGPFRWWLHQAFSDNLPFDRLAAELVQMEGSAVQGAPSGFAQASFNDAPMAAKADIIAKGFLGLNLSCARCHDAPQHPYKQKDLFSLAAMLTGKPVSVPETSTVHMVEGFRQPLVKVTLKPGEPVAPTWPFDVLVAQTQFPLPAPQPLASAARPAPDAAPVVLARTSASETRLPPPPGPAPAPATRRQLAAVLVAPEHPRFAQVLVNRVWKRYMGRGLVEPADDWASAQASHPELLDYLARKFVASGYDLKQLARLILNSHAYQRRAPAAAAEETKPQDRLFAGPYRRRMAAEQVVDSLFRAVGKPLRSEPLNLSPLGDRPLTAFLDLGRPRRAWEFTALSNERDRPSLALPMAQSIADVLSAYGWRQARQDPITTRDDGPTPMQTLILANGIMGTRIARLSDDSALTDLCLEDLPLDRLVRELYLRVLTREPSAAESRAFIAYLAGGYATRVVKGAKKKPPAFHSDGRVSWANHLSPEANAIRLDEERRLRLGDQPTGRLTSAFRERFEDCLWALVNAPEFVVIP